MSLAVRVVAFMHAKEGEEEAVKRAVTACVAPSRAEDGNVSYAATRDEEDSRLFVVVEHWASREAREGHLQSAHFEELGRQVDDAGRLDRHVFHVLGDI